MFSSGDEALKRWSLALRNPFDPKAQGVKIPDPYQYPTSSFKTEGTITLTSNSSGVCSVLLLPHPFLSMVNMTDGVITTSMSRYTPTFGPRPNYAAVPRTVLEDKLSNFRVVSVGYEIRNLIN